MRNITSNIAHALCAFGGYGVLIADKYMDPWRMVMVLRAHTRGGCHNLMLKNSLHRTMQPPNPRKLFFALLTTSSKKRRQSSLRPACRHVFKSHSKGLHPKKHLDLSTPWKWWRKKGKEIRVWCRKELNSTDPQYSYILYSSGRFDYELKSKWRCFCGERSCKSPLSHIQRLGSRLRRNRKLNRSRRWQHKSRHQAIIYYHCFLADSVQSCGTRDRSFLTTILTLFILVLFFFLAMVVVWLACARGRLVGNLDVGTSVRMKELRRVKLYGSAPKSKEGCEGQKRSCRYESWQFADGFWIALQ